MMRQMVCVSLLVVAACGGELNGDEQLAEQEAEVRIERDPTRDRAPAETRPARSRLRQLCAPSELEHDATCTRAEHFAWNGSSCQQLRPCVFASDAGDNYRDQAICERAHQRCPDRVRPDAEPTRPRPERCPADLNGDGVVDRADVQALFWQWGCSPRRERCDGDLDGDGGISRADLQIVLDSFGRCP